MALVGTGDALGLAIKNAVDSLSDAQKKDRDEIYKAFGRGIIAHLTDALVSSGAVIVPGATGGGPGLPGNLV